MASPRNTIYTRENLSAAVADASTLSEVITNLGLEDTIQRRRYISSLIKEHGIDASRLRNAAQLYTDADLAEAVAASKSVVEVAQRLGAVPVGGTTHHLSRRIKRLNLDTSHFHSAVVGARRLERPTSAGFRRENRRLVVDEDMLRAVVPAQHTVADVVRALGLEVNSKRHQVVRDTIERLGLDTSHFLGQGHLRGRPNRGKLAPEEILQFRPDQHYRRDATRLRRAMLESGVSNACATCGLDAHWRGHPLTLEVDHINGDFRDNRLENLRLLCPNCHAITNNYCRKKRGVSAEK